MKVKKYDFWGGGRYPRPFIPLKEKNHEKVTKEIHKVTSRHMTLTAFLSECFVVKPINNFRLAFHPCGASIGIDLGEKGKPPVLTFVSRHKTMEGIEKVVGKNKTERLWQLFKKLDKRRIGLVGEESQLESEARARSKKGTGRVIKDQKKVAAFLEGFFPLLDRQELVERMDREIQKCFRPILVEYCRKRKWGIPPSGPLFISDKAKISGGFSEGIGFRSDSKKLLNGTGQWHPDDIKDYIERSRESRIKRRKERMQKRRPR